MPMVFGITRTFLMCITVSLIGACGKTPVTSAPEEPQRGKDGVQETVPTGEAQESPTDSASPLPPLEFVKDTSCQACHASQFESWLGSHHERAMDHATAETVLGDFNDGTFSQFDEHWRFFTENGGYKVGYREGDGEEKVYPVEYTFGLTPLQQYLVPFPGGRYQCVPVAWDVIKKRWYHLYPDEPMREGDPIHWTGRLQNWNYMCAECHSTNVQTGYDNATDTFKTTFSDINVGCQACHGPGSAHAVWAEKKQPLNSPDYNAHGLVVDFAAGDGAYEVDQCARCHSRRSPAQAEDQHGRAFLDNFQLSTLQESLYFPDGQIQDEVYVYGSFVQSRMHHAGIRCTDCHDPHNARLLESGNELCVRCHQEFPPLEFQTVLPGLYDDKTHHFHEPGTPGAQCVNCHMADRVYMGIDARRDHSFRVPRPDLSVTLGTPNACNQCHQDKDAAWAAEAFEQWYGPKERPRHFANAIAGGRRGDAAAEEELAVVAGDETVPALVRATALELLQSYPGPVAAEALLTGLKDPSPLVRAQAVGGMDRLPPQARGEVLGPLVMDTMASVRIGAARLLAGAPGLTEEVSTGLTMAMVEYTALQLATADQPEAHLNLALLHAAEGKMDQAEAAYRTAIARDAQFIPARVNLANLLNAQGRNGEAEHLLMEAIGLAPKEGELHYSMGLLLAEAERLTEAAVYMKQATELMPGHGRVFYNYGLLLQHLEKRSAAEPALLKAHELSPEDGAILQALVIFYSQDERWTKAKNHAQALLALDPTNHQLQGWVARILRQ